MTIAQIQHLLAFLGFYSAPVDGVWGQKSRQGTAAFQASVGLDPDGIPGENTQKALRQAVARESEADFWDTVPNFTQSEFTCPCGCGRNNISHDLVRVCQRLRDHFDAPLEPSSGLRCPEHNAKVGGVPNSKHLSGRAVDFRIRGRTAAQVLPLAQAQGEIRYAYAIDEQFVHMEMP